MNLRWLMRMSRWARNPPSEKRVKLGLAIFAICLALFAYEYFIGAPEWMEGFKSRGRLRP